MTKKRKKLEAVLAKLKEQQADIELKIQKTETDLLEVTNTEIHEMVHKAEVTPDQLAVILESLKNNDVPGNFPIAEKEESDET